MFGELAPQTHPFYPMSDKETKPEPYWKPQLRKILEETKEHQKSVHKDMAKLRFKTRKDSCLDFLWPLNRETQEEISNISTFVEIFPAGGATVHDLIMFLEEHVL